LNMKKISLVLFDIISAWTFVSFIISIWAIVIGIIFTIKPQRLLDYEIINGIFILSLIFWILTVPIYFFTKSKSRLLLCLEENDFCIVLKNKKGKYITKKYLYNQISVANYCICKWYMIPFSYFYKSGQGGHLYFKIDNGDRYNFTILYVDFLKITQKIQFHKIT